MLPLQHRRHWQSHGCHVLPSLVLPVKDKRKGPPPPNTGRSETPHEHAGLETPVCRAQVKWRTGSAPSLTLHAERSPLTPYLTPYHNARVRDITYGDMRGERTRASRLENHAASQLFWFHRLYPNSLPVSARALTGLGGRTQALPAAARDASLQHPPAPILRRVNAQTLERVWLRQAIHFVLAPAASQDG